MCVLDGSKSMIKLKVPESSSTLGSYVWLGLGVHKKSIEGRKELTVQFITVVSAAKGDEHKAENNCSCT